MLSTFFPLVVVAVVNIVIGTVWYGPLFGRQWRHYAGINLDYIRQHGLKPWQAILGGFVTSVVGAFILLQVINLAGANTVPSAWYVTFLVWLGFVATTHMSSYLWEGKSHKLILIYGGYTLVSMLVAATILVLMK